MSTNETPIRVHVLLFAAHREAAGRNRIEVTLPVGATVADVFSRLCDDTPALAQLGDFTTFAVNRQIAPVETRVRDGDEVALLQPVSGGARD